MHKQHDVRRIMIVVATSGIVAGCACNAPEPSPTVRAAVSENLSLAADAMHKIEDAYFSGGMNGVKAAAGAWNSQNGGVGATSTYVASVLINDTSGEIVITYSANLPEVSGKTLTLTPNMPIGTILAEGLKGQMQWACSSTSNATAAVFYGFDVRNKGTVPSQYAPPPCQ